MSAPSTRGYVLAFDFGLRHIGVASGQTVTGTATPLITLRARHGRPDWAAVAELAASWRPLYLLVGLPLNMDDTESDMSERAREFAAALERHTGIPCLLVDERLTSRAAREYGGEHAAAAALIAETWLNQRG
ncbi:MAG: Holliday junction resolvase RuvX [Gammaproteobacteria bacterium]|nr:Holliday junction resolvase RuvX [Gammaproteobacteria bacterium]